MPCYDGGPSPEFVRKEKEILDRQARTACQAMGILERFGMLHHVDAEARAWWEEHKREDEARVESERMEARAKVADKRAKLEKLKRELGEE